ncbi:PAP/fibrillin family protein [Romeria aff. gracilis LEGE 07310]|uniref:PAP/fibrillin family protein n=1 Tax=Vasconcelosia minhoensis LEGE 07310 TaxID=915328 RepID=A0A8J7AVZ2_9CYAN|nr:PAP/fibrillin family protein [Romeria gracilis]MBE9076722.1 PAP/fibrillin family protein [Romeria aff. gracilis LEGE 07310]
MLGKAELKAAIAGKNRGLLASETDRLAIASAIAKLEDRNPHSRPLEEPELLDGDWRLLYTTSQDLLGLDGFPLVKLGNIYQCVRTAESAIYNLAEVSSLPYCEALVAVAARFEPVSARRVNVRFSRAVFGLQRLLDYRSPGQFIARLTAQDRLSWLQGIDFGINADRQQGWLDITYLDADLRIGRGNQGSLFVLTK